MAADKVYSFLKEYCLTEAMLCAQPCLLNLWFNKEKLINSLELEFMTLMYRSNSWKTGHFLPLVEFVSLAC